MRVVVSLAVGVVLAWSAAGRAEGLPSHALSYSGAIKDAPPGMQAQSALKSWTLEGCRKWISTTTLSLAIQIARHRIVQRTEMTFEDTLDGPVALASYRASGDAARIERKLKAVFPDHGAARIEIAGNEGNHAGQLPADIVRPRLVPAYIVAELLKGSTRFELASINPAVASGWTRETLEVIDRWPFAAAPLAGDIADQLKGHIWNVKATRAGDRSGKSVYFQIHESGIFVRIATDKNGQVVEQTISKLAFLPPASC